MNKEPLWEGCLLRSFKRSTIALMSQFCIWNLKKAGSYFKPLIQQVSIQYISTHVYIVYLQGLYIHERIMLHHIPNSY